MSDDDPCAREVEWAGGKHWMTLNDPVVLNSIEGIRPLRMRVGILGGIISGLPGELTRRLARFQSMQYSLDDVEDTIWHGLVCEIGRKGADELIDRHVRGKPIEPSAILAYNLLVALFQGDAAEGDGNGSGS